MEIYSKGFAKAFTMAFGSCILLIPSKSQAQSTLSLNPERVYEAIEKSHSGDLKGYLVKYKEVSYHPMIEGNLQSDEYKSIQEQLQRQKPAYDDYRKLFVADSTGRDNVANILKNIDLYLSSNEKSDVKDKYLIEAQSIADRQNLQIQGPDNGLIATVLTQANQQKSTKTYRLHNGKKPASNKEIEYYRSQVQSIKFDKVRMPYTAEAYLELLAKSKSIPKTVKGKVQSQETLSKNVLFVDKEATYADFSGDFKILPERYVLVLQDAENQFLKNELLIYDNSYGSNSFTQPYPLMQKVGTEDFYFITSDEFYRYLSAQDSKAELLTMVHKLGYKEYDDGYGEYYIKSKTAEIKLDAGLYDALKSNPNYISQYDAAKIKINALITQSVLHSKTLDKYISQYRIQRSRMSTANLNAWRTATTNAQKLLNQINKLEEPYEGNYSFRQLDDSKRRILDNFVDNLLASKGILGM